jgi:hypothetical protein
MTDDEHAEYIAALHAAADRRCTPHCWEPYAYPAEDAQVREGDVRRGLWLLAEAYDGLLRECAVQRRRRLVDLDPNDAPALRQAARVVIAAAMDVEWAVEPRAWSRFGDDYRGRIVNLLNSVEPGDGDRYLQSVQDAADALAESEALEAMPSPAGDGDPLALHALFNHPRGAERKPVVLSLSGHLLAMGVRPGVCLGLLEAFDQARCKPPLGSVEVERLLRWCADRQADALEGEAA